jgi:hypothetical protein
MIFYVYPLVRDTGNAYAVILPGKQIHRDLLP